MSVKPIVHLSWTLPPSVNTLWAGRVGSRRTPRYEAWIAENKAPEKYRLNIDYPVRVELHFHKLKSRRDVDNGWKATLDQLVREGVLKDDRSTIVKELLVVNFEAESQSEFAEIFILECQVV